MYKIESEIEGNFRKPIDVVDRLSKRDTILSDQQ